MCTSGPISEVEAEGWTAEGRDTLIRGTGARRPDGRPGARLSRVTVRAGGYPHHMDAATDHRRDPGVTAAGVGAITAGQA